MNVERLKTLANYMRTVPENVFDISVFIDPSVTKDELNQSGPFDYVYFLKEGACGTPACVAGHAATIPEFQKAGFRLRFLIGDDGDIEELSPVYGEEEEEYALMKFFGLGYEDVMRIFAICPYYYKTNRFYGVDDLEDITPTIVADRLDRFIAEKAS